MESLYVCIFSNGHIKVGRSATPNQRIKQHQDRVSCMGVELSQSYITECPDNDEGREQSLINRCVSQAQKRHQLEWFVGLDFDVVCKWAYEAAHSESSDPFLPPPSRWTVLVSELRQSGQTQASIADYCGCDQTTISALYSGRAKEPLHSLGEKLIALHALKA